MGGRFSPKVVEAAYQLLVDPKLISAYHAFVGKYLRPNVGVGEEPQVHEYTHFLLPKFIPAPAPGQRLEDNLWRDELPTFAPQGIEIGDNHPCFGVQEDTGNPPEVQPLENQIWYLGEFLGSPDGFTGRTSWIDYRVFGAEPVVREVSTRVGMQKRLFRFKPFAFIGVDIHVPDSLMFKPFDPAALNLPRKFEGFPVKYIPACDEDARIYAFSADEKAA